MKLFSLKKDNGFTLIETVCYVSFVSFIMVSIISFHFFYRQKIRANLNKISDYHKIQKFVDISEKSLLAIKAKYPSSSVTEKKQSLSVQAGEGCRFDISWNNGQGKINLTENNQTKKQLFSCDVPDAEFFILSRSQGKI